MSEQLPIPEDHDIREIWKLNRLDTAGFIELAKSGDTAAAKYLMKLYVRIRKRVLEERSLGFYLPTYPSETHVLLEEYILEALTLSCRTGDANKWFNFGKPANRPKATYKEKQRHCDIGYRFARLREEIPSNERVKYLVAQEFNISESEALRCYKKYFKL